jgi:hypothetical protein
MSNLFALVTSTGRQQSPVVADDPDYTLALEQARRNFDSQAGQLADLRKRAVQLVGIGGLAATFIGGLSASEPDGFSVWNGAALGAFLLVVAICLSIWWPRKLVASQDPAILVEWAELPAMTQQLMNRDMALHVDDHYEANKEIIDEMVNGFCVAIGLLAIEILCLAVGLWIH